MTLDSDEVASIVERDIEKTPILEVRALLRSILVKPARHQSKGYGGEHCTFWVVAELRETGTAVVFSDDFYPGPAMAWGTTSIQEPYFAPDGYTYGPTTLYDAFYWFASGVTRGWSIARVHPNRSQEILEFGLNFDDALVDTRRLNWKLDQPLYRIVENTRRGEHWGTWRLFKVGEDGSNVVIASSLPYDEALDRQKRLNNYFDYPMYQVKQETD